MSSGLPPLVAASQSRQPLAGVFNGPFAKPLAAAIGKPDIVLLGCPIDAGKPALVLMHMIFPAVIW